jgi:hypothetical protein
VLAAASPAARVALVRAIGFAPDRRFHGVLAELLARREPAVLREILNVLVRAPLLVEVERLTALLQDPHVRSDTRRVFRALGERGLVHLITALDDPRTPLAVRRHIPRTISQYRSRRAIAALVARLAREPDGNTEFKILRAVGRMRADHPELAIDATAIRTYIRGAIADAARYATLADRFAEVDAEGASAQLIRELLVEKRERAVEHVFRAFAILWPNTGLRSVHAAIASSDPERRAAAREVLEQLLRAEQRAPLFAILDDELDPEARRQRLGELAAGPFPTYESFLAALLDDPSESLRCIAAHHVAERHLVALRANLVARAALAGPPLVVHAFEQAIARLDG